jgi:uncharacterized protein YhbP (UPF0306 family)
VREAALAYVEAHQVMTLATVGPEGVWAAAVFYASDGFNLYFLSAGHTRHAQNFNYQPTISAAIQEEYHDWPGIRGIQLEGEVRVLNGRPRLEAIRLYSRKFPFLKNSTPQIVTAMTKVNWYQLSPTRLYFIDNSRGLGHRDEIYLA